MASRFTKLNDLYWVAIDRNFWRFTVGGSLIGAAVGGVWVKDEYNEPKVLDTTLHALGGAFVGGIAGAVAPSATPLVLPIVAFVGPIHMYKKYRWEQSVKNLK